MSKKLMLIILVGAFVCLQPTFTRAELVHIPTEVVWWTSTSAYNGVTLFTPMQQTFASSGKTSTYLVDMTGRLVNSWVKSSLTETVLNAKLEENGNLSRSCVMFKPAGADPTNVMLGTYGGCGAIEEVNWDGSTASRYQFYNAQYRSHDDYMKIYNSQLGRYTYLVIVWEPHTQAEALAAGATGAVPSNWSLDAVYEYDPSTGSIVWKWSFFDHLTTTPTVKTKFNINTASTTRTAPTVDWLHCNSVGYNPANGYIVINSREFNELFVIDHDATFVDTANWQANYTAAASTSGDFIYRFGSTMNYGAGTAPSYRNSGTQQLWGAHGAAFIPSVAYPGGPSLSGYGVGDILVFNNFGCNGNPIGLETQAQQINPHISNFTSNQYVTGSSYVWPETVPYLGVANQGQGMPNLNLSRQIYWRFKAQGTFGMYSAHLGSTQRLPNGNTLMCEGEAGHMIEVTYAWSTSEVNAIAGPALAWEYSNPMNNGVAWKYNENNDPGGGYQVYAAYRYDVGHPALVNRVVMNADYTVVPAQTPYPSGVGATLTGAKPCSAAPCAYKTDTNTGLGIPALPSASVSTILRR